MFNKSAALILVAGALFASPASSASITLDGLTTPIEVNAQIKKAPRPIASGVGNAVASGLVWSGGEGFNVGIDDSFVAWCFDLIHPVRLGATYDYAVVDAPYSNSYLLEGADVRVSNLFNANYDSLKADDSVQAAAFQLAIWEVANDSDFSILDGVFQAQGYGNRSADITATAQKFLSNGASYDGAMNWKTTFLETREESGTQNLVTALRSPNVAAVPLPASGLLLIAGLAGLAKLRTRKQSKA